MLEWFRQLGRALRNLARIARANPIWAVQSLALSPVALIRHLFGVVILFLVVALVLSLGAEAALWFLGVPKDSFVRQLVMVPVGIVILLVPLRALVQPLILRYGGPDGDDTHGSARFATDRETRPLAVVCIDPKGENARIAAHQRGRFGPVHVLDPFGITGLHPAAFNPLDRIDPAGLDVADDCMTLADALVHDAHNEQTEAHWNEEAKALIAGLLMHIVAREPDATRTLATLRDHLTLAPAAFAALLETMQGCGGLVARAANRHLGKSDREAAGVLSSAQRHTHFLDSPRMTTTLGRSDFRFADLKERPASIFLVLPPDRRRQAGLLRRSRVRRPRNRDQIDRPSRRRRQNPPP